MIDPILCTPVIVGGNVSLLKTSGYIQVLIEPVIVWMNTDLN